MRALCLIVGIFLVLASPARAQFGDCMDSDYLGAFGSPDHAADPLSPVRTITCIVEFEFTVSTPRGERRIRGIRDAGADWAFRPGAMAEIEAGARAAAAAMPMLGDYDIGNVTILILDDSYDALPAPPHPDGDVAAATSPNLAGGECRITAFLLGAGGDPENVAYTTAHEIFHCIQGASLTAAQWATTTGGGAWWAEGSAEYFAALAVPSLGDRFDRAGAFEAAIDGPLYGQTYGMAVFFYWLHGRSGPGALMPFLRRMEGSSSAGAQRAAMRRAQSDREWLEFAQAYADRDISHPNGSRLAFSGDDGDDITFVNTRTHRITLSPFTIRRGWVTYECGRWRNELTPSDANIGAREESGGWGAYPSEADAPEGSPVRYRFAALHTGDSDRRLAIRAERIHSCQPCAGSRELDVCVIGTWQMTGGGPIEWMRRQGVPIVRAEPGERIIRFGDDGVYYGVPFGMSLTVETHDGVAEGVGSALPAAGRWSIAGGRLATCQDSGGVSGTVTARGISIPIAVPGGGTLMQSYSCSESSLQTTLDVGSGAPMHTTYTKIAGPPASD